MLSVQIAICLVIFGAGCLAFGLGAQRTAREARARAQQAPQSSPVKSKSAAWYHAEWCGPCKRMHPTISNMIKEGYDIVVIDVDKDEYFNPVTHVPTMRFYPETKRNGKYRREVVGYMTRAQIEELLVNLKNDNLGQKRMPLGKYEGKSL